MDERLALIEQEKQNALNNSNTTYNQMLQDNQNLYNQQNTYANTYEKTQNEVLDKQLAFQQEQINQQKEIARQNMETESKKAKNDYTSYINPYGYQAESLASQGLNNSGVSETAKLGGWNAYQNRLATANKVMQDAFVQYDNDMNEARLNNDVQKAQNALNKLQMQLQYTESFYNNKNTITQNQLSNNQSLDSEYYNRYQTEYANIQAEKAREEAIRQWEAEMAEQQRQYNESMAYQKEQDALAQENWEKEYALSKQTVNYNTRGGTVSTLTEDTEVDNETDGLGNSKDTQGKSDYYWKKADGSDTDQPSYINNTRLTSSGLTAGDLGVVGTGIGPSYRIWKADGRYYVWDNNAKTYNDVTDEYKKATTKIEVSTMPQANSMTGSKYSSFSYTK